MKIWPQLTDQQRERSIHLFQHQVIDSFLEEGFAPEQEPQSDEDKEEIKNVQECLERVKTMEEHADKVETCFEDEATFNVSFSIAIDLAQNSYFIEENETVCFLKDVDECFDDDETSEEKQTEAQINQEEEVKLAEIVPFPRKPNKHSLN